MNNLILIPKWRRLQTIFDRALSEPAWENDQEALIHFALIFCSVEETAFVHNCKVQQYYNFPDSVSQKMVVSTAISMSATPRIRCMAYHVHMHLVSTSGAMSVYRSMKPYGFAVAHYKNQIPVFQKPDPNGLDVFGRLIVDEFLTPTVRLRKIFMDFYDQAPYCGGVELYQHFVKIFKRQEKVFFNYHLAIKDARCIDDSLIYQIIINESIKPSFDYPDILYDIYTARSGSLLLVSQAGALAIYKPDFDQEPGCIEYLKKAQPVLLRRDSRNNDVFDRPPI